MANSKKKTQREFYNELLALAINEEQREFINGRLAQLDKTSNTIRRIDVQGENSLAGRMRIRSILNDSQDLLWICSNVGLFQYNTRSKLITQAESVHNCNYSIKLRYWYRRYRNH